jgi:signal peptidase I
MAYAKIRKNKTLKTVLLCLFFGILLRSTTVLSDLHGESMTPTLHNGQWGLELTLFPAYQIPNGTIITYYSPHWKVLVCHRIVAVNEDSEGVYYSTKGDNNEQWDPWLVRPGQVKAIYLFSFDMELVVELVVAGLLGATAVVVAFVYSRVHQRQRNLAHLG